MPGLPIGSGLPPGAPPPGLPPPVLPGSSGPPGMPTPPGIPQPPGGNPFLRQALGQYLGEQSKVDPNYASKTMKQMKLNILGLMQHFGLRVPKVEKNLNHALSSLSAAIEEHEKWQNDQNRVNALTFSLARPGFSGNENATPQMGPVPTLPTRTPS